MAACLRVGVTKLRVEVIVDWLSVLKFIRTRGDWLVQDIATLSSYVALLPCYIEMVFISPILLRKLCLCGATFFSWWLLDVFSHFFEYDFDRIDVKWDRIGHPSRNHLVYCHLWRIHSLVLLLNNLHHLSLNVVHLLVLGCLNAFTKFIHTLCALDQAFKHMGWGIF